MGNQVALDCSNRDCCCEGNQGMDLYNAPTRRDQKYPVAGEGRGESTKHQDYYDEYFQNGNTKESNGRKTRTGDPIKARSVKDHDAQAPAKDRLNSGWNAKARNDDTTGAKAQTPAELEVEFQKPDGSRTRLTFKERPLGMKYEPGSSPLAISDVIKRRHAQAMGVQVGWKVLTIDGQDVSQSPFKEATELLTSKTSGLQLM